MPSARGGELDGGWLQRLLADEPFVARLDVLAAVSSTNDALRRLASGGAPEGTVVLAEEQTAGRGRLGRSWHSPPRLGLYLSVLLRPHAPPEQVRCWPLGAALAACRACRGLTDCAVEIEWPNDLVSGGRKLGGILAEARNDAQGTELVVGAGINVGHGPEDFPAALAGQATSLGLETGGRAPARELLAAAYLRELGRVVRVLREEGWPALAAAWAELAPGSRGRRVRVLRAGGPGELQGMTCGIDGSGALLVERPGGGIERVHLADGVIPLEH